MRMYGKNYEFLLIYKVVRITWILGKESKAAAEHTNIDAEIYLV